MKAYIVRLRQDEHGHFSGHVSDPLTHERMRFASWPELQRILSRGLSTQAPHTGDIDTDEKQERDHA